MALEQNDILYDVDIDLQDSLREIDGLRNKLKSFSDDLAVNATQVQQNMRKAAQEYVSYIKRLESEIKDLKKQGQDTTAHDARLSQIRNRQRSAPAAIAGDFARGSEQSQANRAVLQREINEMKSTTNELVGKYFDELNATYLKAVKRSMTNLQNEETLLRNRMSDRNSRATMGDAAYGFMKQRERRDLNGGANQMLSQMGIMNNYALVGGLYASAFSLGNFMVNLDAQFKQFQAITSSTNKEMGLMEDRLLSVSEKTKFTANEIADAATLMGQAGMSAGQVSEAIEPVAKLATAAGTELKDAVDLVTSSLNIFGLQAGDAGHLADVFTAALNESKLTLDQLSAALQYAGNTAATVGVSYNELTAAVGAMANAGIKSGSTIGTGLRQLLVDLITPSKTLKAELSRLGLSLEDIDLKSHGLSGVLENLKNAGFDTSSAFSGLEVRAAAAYTALSNNLDTMAELRQSFLLTNAAAEANQTQMESLANTAKNFGSNLGALVYTAFQPFIRTLQNTVAAGAAVLAWLRDMGAIVPIIGTAIATLVSAQLLIRLGSLVAGLIGIGTAATGAAGAMAALRAATLGNPLFLAATVLIGGLQILSAYADTAGRVQSALDSLKTEQNEYQAAVDHTNDRLTSLNATMDDLATKQKALDGGSDMLRQTKVMEVLSTFQELTGEIDASSASVADLIKAMQNLKAELVKGLPDQFGLLVDKIDQRIEILRGAIADQASGNSYWSSSLAASRRFGVGGAIESRDLPMYSEKVAGEFGKDIADAFKLSTGQLPSEDMNGQRAQGLQTTIERMVIAIEKQIKPLDARSGFLGVGGDLTDEESAELKKLKGNLDFLQGLSKAFDPISKNLVQIEAEKADRRVQVTKQSAATLANTSGYQAADAAKVDAKKFLQDRLGEIIKADLPIEQTKQAYDQLETELGKRIDAINQQLKAAADEMKKDGFSDEEIKKVIDSSELKTDLAGLQGAFKKGAEGSVKEAKKLQAYLAEQEQKNVEKQIAAVKKQLADAQNERQVDLLENQLYALDGKLAKLEQEAFDADPNKNVGDNAADLELAKRQIRDGAKTRRDDIVQTVIDKRAELADAANKTFDENLNDQLKRVQDEMKNLASSIDNNSTAEYIKKVKDKLDELNKKAQQLAGQIAGINVSQDYGSFAVGGLPSASATDIQRKIIEAANKAGIPPQIALALASFESGFNPNAKNPGSTAGGIYQNTDANWKSHGLAPGDRSSVDMQIYAGIQDMLRTQKEMGTTQLSFRDYYGAHLLGQAGYQKAIQNPTGNAVAVLGSDVVAGNGGNIQQTAQQFLDMIVAKASQHLAKVKDMVQKPVDAADDALDTQTKNLTEGATDAMRSATDKIQKNQVKVATKLLDSQAKAMEAQINTLMVQSSKAQDPQALQSIIDQVKSKWADMAAKEIDSFTKANQGTDGFDERLAALKDQLESGLGGKIVTLLDRYQQSIENLEFKPLEEAQAKLSAMQNPLYASKYTDSQVQNAQHDVQLQQQAAQQEKLNQLEQLHAYILQQVSAAEQQYGANSQIVQTLKERQYSVEQSLTGVRRQATADTEAASQSEMTLKDAIEAANRAWMQRNGIMDQNGQMISSAQKVGEAWGQVLDGLGSSMTTLFSDLASGSMKAGDAFKKFGLSVVQMLIQMIAKALVFNMLQSLMGGGTGGGGAGGSLLSLLFGVGGMATGGMIAGVKRAALGEMIPAGNAPFRDSQLRKVMPGEMILRASAVNQIGRDSLERVNALGNRRISAGMPTLPAQQPADQRPVNVWAVLPEEKPQLGPDDVVAYIADDMRRRGTTRSLIKAISSGKM